MKQHPLAIVCPCCMGKAVILAGPPVAMSPDQTAIYNVVRSAKYGIPNAGIGDRIYAGRRDGGPETALAIVTSQIWRINKSLATVGEKIMWGHGVYRLHRLAA